MAEFTLHVRLVADEYEPGLGEELLERYVTDSDTVRFGDERVADPDDPAVVVPEQSSLEIDDLDAFAEIFDELRRENAVHNVSLWGPNAERFPVPVQHYALQQIGDPDLYVYHAIDDQVTLVVADSEMAAEKVQREVPDAALGYSESPF